ncbi:uncharacterized protein Dwil_GK16195 [Drosophila willistoni]|uniref:Uncharacterized protein n=1 Tax=Drosophila willistoni TaxID=7260 RepID=B4N215_DROWI|nr:uncharacterized protein Dwil_GK16195 [Drosophila willistoni]
MVINLNPSTSSSSSPSSSTSSSSGGSNNLMGIITHSAFNGIIYLQVLCAGDAFAKWITVQEAMAYCPSGVIAYTKLQMNYIYGVPMEWLFHTD